MYISLLKYFYKELFENAVHIIRYKFINLLNKKDKPVLYMSSSFTFVGSLVYPFRSSSFTFLKCSLSSTIYS